MGMNGHGFPKFAIEELRELFDFVGAAGQPFSVEGVPVGRHLRAVWVLDDDAIDRKEDFSGFPNGEIVAEGGAGDIFNLGRAVPFFYAERVFCRFGHEPLVEFGLGDDLQFWVLQVEAVGIAALDDQTFFAAGVDPSVEDVIFDIEELRESFPIPRSPFGSEGIDDFEFLAGRV